MRQLSGESVEIKCTLFVPMVPSSAQHLLGYAYWITVTPYTVSPVLLGASMSY
jgi:hypothetical protein